MATDDYLTIGAAAEGYYQDKGSRFLAFAWPAETVEEVQEKLDAIRREYHDARHICYAYSLGCSGEQVRSSDGGEPAGTAGKPILTQISAHGLTNVLVIVVRYFGGVLLGTGGLVRAYRTAAKNALSAASVIRKTVDETLCFECSYEALDAVLNELRRFGAILVASQYQSTGCQLTIKLRKGMVVGWQEKGKQLGIHAIKRSEPNGMNHE